MLVPIRCFRMSWVEVEVEVEVVLNEWVRQDACELWRCSVDGCRAGMLSLISHGSNCLWKGDRK